MISRSCPPAVGTIHTCDVLEFASRSISATLNNTHLPSGETPGSPTRLSFIISSKVKGCLVWVREGTAIEKRKARITQRISGLHEDWRRILATLRVPRFKLYNQSVL